MAIKVVAFDADDTLWVNEPYFSKAEQTFCLLMADFLPPHTMAQELFKTEMNNLALYGYGIKGFMLSMIETALKVSNYSIGPKSIEQLLHLGKEMLEMPIELLEDVEDVLLALQPKYRLVLATKGDLLDQERKLEKSGLSRFFHHIEIMSDKQEKDYQKLIRHLDILPEEFLMIGNSIKSDVLPVLQVGGHAIHVPFHTTWEHEKVDIQINHPQFRQLEHRLELLNYL
jgi:putative hydrolase of the HAD superfamily